MELQPGVMMAVAACVCVFLASGYGWGTVIRRQQEEMIKGDKRGSVERSINLFLEFFSPQTSLLHPPLFSIMTLLCIFFTDLRQGVKRKNLMSVRHITMLLRHSYNDESTQ
jgi:hypothetical protein